LPPRAFIPAGIAAPRDPPDQGKAAGIPVSRRASLRAAVRSPPEARRMAELKAGRIVEWHRLSPVLSLFRVVGLESSPFPGYEAGQYIALRRDDCLLTRKVKEGNEVR